MQIDPTTLDRVAAYRLLTAVLVPRPIAWIGSVSVDGLDNLAPFSYFMGVSSEPPMVAVSVAHGRGGARKHTARNLLTTGEFTVSMPEERDLDALHATSAAHAESEFDAVAVPRAASTRIAAPWVASARVAFECRVVHHVPFAQVDLFVGQIVQFHLDDALWGPDGCTLAPDPAAAAYHPLARLGGEGYAALGSVFTRPPARVPSRS
jgi:flavin reductase (DIM6/NTAB) family NADH-FMN oxidoreductase RutF